LKHTGNTCYGEVFSLIESPDRAGELSGWHQDTGIVSLIYPDRFSLGISIVRIQVGIPNHSG